MWDLFIFFFIVRPSSGFSSSSSSFGLYLCLYQTATERVNLHICIWFLFSSSFSLFLRLFHFRIGETRTSKWNDWTSFRDFYWCNLLRFYTLLQFHGLCCEAEEELKWERIKKIKWRKKKKLTYTQTQPYIVQRFKWKKEHIRSTSKRMREGGGKEVEGEVRYTHVLRRSRRKVLTSISPRSVSKYYYMQISHYKCVLFAMPGECGCVHVCVYEWLGNEAKALWCTLIQVNLVNISNWYSLSLQPTKLSSSTHSLDYLTY